MQPAVHSLRAAGPTPQRLVFFEVRGRRDLAQRAAAALPGLRFAWRRSWTRDPGAPRPSLLGGAPKVGLWLWPDTEQQFAEQATALLLGFVHPLLGRDLPCCLGFPFAAAVFAPRPLGVGDTAALDLEDIGRLLGVTQTPVAADPPARRSAPHRAAPLPAEPPLDACQRAAVEHARGPARVLAPAGAGKTKTLVARVARLIQRGADPADILLLAFNRKAAEQLEERLAARGIATTRRLGAPAAAQRPAGVHCATFNAFGYRYQREVMGARVLVDQRGAELRGLMRRALDAVGISPAQLKPPRGSDPVGACLHALTHVRAGLQASAAVEVNLESTGDEALVAVPFADLHDHYVRAQAVTGRQSFDDQIYFAVVDMLADPGHRTFIQARFRHVLVDEFQDLNPAQLALVDLLSRPTRDLFVVGDDDQLIYGWRRADPRGILQFHARMPPQPWSATYTLGTNYRCSRAVVASSARLVAHNRVREAKAVQPRTGAPPGALRFAGAPLWPRRAAAMCAFLRTEHARLGCDWRDLAVLCRYRAQQFAVALALDEARIPRTPTLGCRLFTHPVARLLRAYIDLVRAPQALAGDELAFLLNRPTRYQTASFTAAVAAAERPWDRVHGRARPPSLRTGRARSRCWWRRSIAWAARCARRPAPATPRRARRPLRPTTSWAPSSPRSTWWSTGAATPSGRAAPASPTAAAPFRWSMPCRCSLRPTPVWMSACRRGTACAATRKHIRTSPTTRWSASRPRTAWSSAPSTPPRDASTTPWSSPTTTPTCR